MCGYVNDCEPADVFVRKIRVARRDHECFECRCEIGAGSVYRYVSGVWDGCGHSFKVCNECAMACDIFERHHDDSSVIGELEESLKYCMEEESIIDDNDCVILSESGKMWKELYDSMKKRGRIGYNL